MRSVMQASTQLVCVSGKPEQWKQEIPGSPNHVEKEFINSGIYAGFLLKIY